MFSENSHAFVNKILITFLINLIIKYNDFNYSRYDLY